MTTILPGEGVHFRIWAPKRKHARVVLDNRSFPLKPEEHGYFSGTVASARAGSLYRFQLDNDDTLYPDPESRFQPEGPHGPSQIVNPASFKWSDERWPGVSSEGHVLYEMHIGTFTPEGTWDSAKAQLSELASIGITMIEVMPIADFGGRWGWGYDGVNLFAPFHFYGAPDQARQFIAEAHRLGIGVILDVVYNHFGPDGNYLKAFSDEYFTNKYTNDWGESINFSSGPVRDFYLANAAYWIEEFHFDGLRLDATQDIHDPGPEHIITAITQRARKAAGDRSIYIVAENEPQQARMALPVEAGGRGVDALWNDDFHHSAMVAMTGRREAYYTDYRGTPQEFVSAAKYGYLFQGQRYRWQKKRRGSPALHLSPWNFVSYLQNHDQIANSIRGERITKLADAGTIRAMTALLLLGPATPMLFQGQEFGATSPFFFFCDHAEDLSRKVHEGRREFLAQFRSLAQPEVQERIGNPSDPSAFQKSRLDFGERTRNRMLYDLHKDLLQLRRNDPVFRKPRKGGFDGAVLATSAFVLRYFDESHGDRLLMVNLGFDLQLNPAPEPLLAPPEEREWKTLWSSEDPRYGGGGTFPPDSRQNWRIAGRSALVLAPGAVEGES